MSIPPPSEPEGPPTAPSMYEPAGAGRGVYPSAMATTATVGNGVATAAFMLGLFAVLARLATWIVLGSIGRFGPINLAVVIVPALLAISFGIVGLARSRRSGSGRGYAIAGIVLGAVPLVLAVIAAVAIRQL